MSIYFGLARLGRDAELRSTPAGDSVCNLALAFTRRISSTEKATDWIEGALWGKRAEALAPHLLKGGLVSIALQDVHIETYQGTKGQGQKLVGRVLEIELAGGGQPKAPASTPAPAPRQSAKPTPRNNGSEFDDDIPF
jgi:single-strand DNA-binding protein